jgi:hypothetical protein
MMSNASTTTESLAHAITRSQDCLEACLPLPTADPRFRDALYWYVILSNTRIEVPAAVRRCRRPETLANKLVALEELDVAAMTDVLSTTPLEGDHHRLIPGEGVMLSFPERATVLATTSSAPALLKEMMGMWEVCADDAAEADAALRTVATSRLLSARDQLTLRRMDGTTCTLNIKRRGPLVILDISRAEQADPPNRAAEPTLAPMTALLRSRLVDRPAPSALRLAA